MHSVQCFSLPRNIWCQFTDPAEIEDLDGLDGKHEPTTCSMLHTCLLRLRSNFNCNFLNRLYGIIKVHSEQSVRSQLLLCSPNRFKFGTFLALPRSPFLVKCEVYIERLVPSSHHTVKARLRGIRNSLRGIRNSFGAIEPRAWRERLP